LAKEHNAEVWFDVHVGTEGPRPDGSLDGAFSLIDALGGLADGARYRVAIFEFNANNHSQRRALANAMAINAVKRDGRMIVATSANCLQPDGQNDNAWDQGLLFLNPSKVWLQPPGYVTRMFARNYEPVFVASDVQCPGNSLDATAARSEDGKTLVLQVVNTASQPVTAAIRLDGFAPSRRSARVEELSGPLDAVNTADSPTNIVSRSTQWRHDFKNGQASYQFPAFSVTVIRLE
jgi:Alpha-L-arabinofuranosidase C-terminal domain